MPDSVPMRYLAISGIVAAVLLNLLLRTFVKLGGGVTTPFIAPPLPPTSPGFTPPIPRPPIPGSPFPHPRLPLGDFDRSYIEASNRPRGNDQLQNLL